MQTMILFNHKRRSGLDTLLRTISLTCTTTNARIGNKEYLHPAHTFTVSYNGSVGEVFLQDEPFWASDDVNVWYPKFPYNQRIVEYIMSVVRQLKDKYSYTTKWTLDKMQAEDLELPVKSDGAGHR